MNGKTLAMVAAAMAFGTALAQSGGNTAFLVQQACNETRRVAGQVDVLQNNVDEHAARIAKLERGNGSSEVATLQARVAALEATNAELRRKMDGMRAEIVNELMKRIKEIQGATQPKPRQVVTGPYREYVVQPGDTLSVIAEAFVTSVPKIREMNGLKGDNLRVGQKIKVPAK